MSRVELQLLKRRIVDRYDPDYLVDVLRISSEELVELFENRLDPALFTELDDNDEDDDEEGIE